MSPQRNVKISVVKDCSLLTSASCESLGISSFCRECFLWLKIHPAKYCKRKYIDKLGASSSHKYSTFPNFIANEYPRGYDEFSTSFFLSRPAMGGWAAGAPEVSVLRATDLREGAKVLWRFRKNLYAEQ